MGLKSSGSSSWSTTCTKDNGPSFWICSGGFPLTAPLSVQLTNDNGESVACAGCIGSTAGDAQWDFGSNFGSSGTPSDNSGSSNTASPTPATATDNGSGTSSGSSSGTMTISNKDGLNSWWYAVTVVVPEGMNVAWVKMKDSTMSSWETGVSEWDYYKFTGNTPYSPPFHFKVWVSGAAYEKDNVITSLNEGDSGTITLSSAFLAEDEEDISLEKSKTDELIAIVMSACFVALILMALCFICYRRRNKVIAAGVDSVGDGDVITGTSTQKEAGWDMQPIGMDTATAGAEQEQEIMIDVNVTETKD